MWCHEDIVLYVQSFQMVGGACLARYLHPRKKGCSGWGGAPSIFWKLSPHTCALVPILVANLVLSSNTKKGEIERAFALYHDFGDWWRHKCDLMSKLSVQVIHDITRHKEMLAKLIIRESMSKCIFDRVKSEDLQIPSATSIFHSWPVLPLIYAVVPLELVTWKPFQ